MLVPIKTTKILKPGDTVLERGRKDQLIVKEIIDDQDFMLTNQDGSYQVCESIYEFDLVCDENDARASIKKEEDRLFAIAVDYYNKNLEGKMVDSFKPLILGILKDFAKYNNL